MSFLLQRLLLDHMGHGHAYDAYGIDKAVGAVVVVRPDQRELRNLLDRDLRLRVLTLST